MSRIFPMNYPVNADYVFPNNGGPSGHLVPGLGVSGSIDGSQDVIWRLTYPIPPTLPSGTPKLDLWGLANSTSQVARVELKWVAVTAENANLATAKVSEGEQNITLQGTANRVKQTKITLNATTVPAAGQILLADLVFHGTDAAWTINVVATWWPWLIWE